MNNVTITKFKHRQFPVITEKDEDGFYTIECPLLAGCVSRFFPVDRPETVPPQTSALATP